MLEYENQRENRCRVSADTANQTIISRNSSDHDTVPVFIPGGRIVSGYSDDHNTVPVNTGWSRRIKDIDCSNNVVPINVWKVRELKKRQNTAAITTTAAAAKAESRRDCQEGFNKKMTLAAVLDETASRLNHVEIMLKECARLLKFRDKSEHMYQRKKDMAQEIDNLAVPVVQCAVALLRNIARSTAPVAKSTCAAFFKWCEARQSRAVQKKIARRLKRPDSHGIPNHILEAELTNKYLHSSTKRRDIRSTNWLDSLHRRPAGSVDDAAECHATVIPAPANGSIYTKPEAVRILAGTKKNTKERSSMMKKMIRSGWAPTHIRTLQRLMKIHEEGGLVLDDSWSGNGHQGGGRKRALENDDIDRLVSRQRLGEKLGTDSIKNAIVEARENLVRRSGSEPLVVNRSVGRTTIAKYTNTIAWHAGAAPSSTVVDEATGNVVDTAGIFGRDDDAQIKLQKLLDHQFV